MRRGLLAAAITAAAAALAVPAAAPAAQVISMPGKYFEPANVTVLAGDTVTWRNDDLINHDVAALGAFVSGPIGRMTSYSFDFAAAGSYPYRCTIHAFMNGSVTVAPVLLSAPDGVVLSGTGVQLTGRAPAGTPRVAIERSLDGTTWADTGIGAVPDAAGAFSALVPAAEGAVFRAAVAGGTSAVVAPRVAARVDVSLRVAGGHHHKLVHVRTGKAGAGLVATLETYHRWRFAWRALGSPVRLDKAGRASFPVPVALKARARVVLTAERGGNALVTSRPVRLSDGKPSRSPIPPPPAVGGGHGEHETPAATDGAPADGHGGHPAA